MNLPKVRPWAWGTLLALSFAALQLLVGRSSDDSLESVTSQGAPERVEEAPCEAGTLPDDGVCLPAPVGRAKTGSGAPDTPEDSGPKTP